MAELFFGFEPVNVSMSIPSKYALGREVVPQSIQLILDSHQASSLFSISYSPDVFVLICLLSDRLSISLLNGHKW